MPGRLLALCVLRSQSGKLIPVIRCVLRRHARTVLLRMPVLRNRLGGRQLGSHATIRAKPALIAPAALVCLPVSVGKSIRLYLADGTPGGLLTAEIMNWTGHVVAAPRSDLAALLKRPETSRTGIYVLLGDDPESLGGTLAYIGEGDEVRTRLQQHARDEEQGGKDFWDRAIVLTSKDANLTKAHARYLESRCIALAQHARRARLINGTAPPLPPLPEADESDMEYFIAQAAIILPVLPGFRS